MSQQHQSYISLESVVLDYMTEAELSQSKYFKVWHLAFRGMDNIGIDAFYRVKSVKLPINPNFTATLPDDYVNYSKVGVLNDRGDIIPLYQNDNLTSYADLRPNRLEVTQDDTINTFTNFTPGLWWNYWNGSAFINIYGTPSGAPFVGAFKIDVTNGVIILDESFIYEYLMLEYICSPKQGQEYYVPVQFREALIAWLWWKDKRAVNTARGQVGLSRDAKADFFNERRLAIARWKPVREMEEYEASQEMTRMSLKT